MSYVNQIQDKDATLHDIHDKRLEVTAADAGKVVSVDETKNAILVKGCIPGPKKSLVTVRTAVKAQRKMPTAKTLVNYTAESTVSE